MIHNTKEEAEKYLQDHSGMKGEKLIHPVGQKYEVIDLIIKEDENGYEVLCLMKGYETTNPIFQSNASSLAYVLKTYRPIIPITADTQEN